MRGGGKEIYYGIMYDSIPLVIDSNNFVHRFRGDNEINYMLPIFIIVMIGSDLYLFFNKNITSQEITQILKNILYINTEVILDPPIELPAVSVDAPPTYNGQEIPNIADIEKYDWPLSYDNSFAKDVLLENLFRTKLKDPFQHISKRFIKFKKTGVFSATFEKNIYSGEISDTIPLDKINETSLTKHKFTSPATDVVTEKFKNLMSSVNNDDPSKLQNLVMGLVIESRSPQNSPQNDLYKQYIPDEELKLIVQLGKPEITQGRKPPQETIRISNKLQKNWRGYLSWRVSSSDLIAKNVLNSINDDIGDQEQWESLAGTFTPLPASWLKRKIG